MIPHIIDFLVDYFTNLNAKKIFGGVLVLLGLVLISRIQGSGNANKAVLFALCGIMIGGIGFVVIYYDIAKDKTNGGFDELETLSEAYKLKEHEERNVSGWHMNQGSDEKSNRDKT